jgi:hypothetical protein
MPGTPRFVGLTRADRQYRLCICCQNPSTLLMIAGGVFWRFERRDVPTLRQVAAYWIVSSKRGRELTQKGTRNDEIPYRSAPGTTCSEALSEAMSVHTCPTGEHRWRFPSVSHLHILFLLSNRLIRFPWMHGQTRMWTLARKESPTSSLRDGPGNHIPALY